MGEHRCAYEDGDRPFPHPQLSVRKKLLVDPRRIAALEAENKRLREAVQSAIETWDNDSPGRGLTERQALAKLRAALEPMP